MSIRLIALDLDGTLINSRWEISEQDRQALVTASERGVQIVVLTGRRPLSAAPYVAQIPCPVTTITSNGALIRSPSGEVVYQDFLPRDVALKALDVVSEYRPYTVAIFHLPGRGQVVMQDNAILEGPLGWYVKTSLDHLLLVVNLEAAIDTDPVQLMIGGPLGRIEPAEVLVRDSEVGPLVHLTWTKYPARDIALLDVMNRGCSKGRALRFWARESHLAPREIMAVGDNFNDLEMLEFAGLPVLMGNHCAGLARPGWALTASSDENGVARAIETYVLKA
jgi:hydroxymethylpyrimidine pyrophosphatase-like HAD family hydrolase